tara:strand:- start:458 stop:913 length:456 start_codon:yes stop_codon:yes gene_type:complete
MDTDLLYSENPKMAKNKPIWFIIYIILNVAGLVAAIRFDQQSYQIVGLVFWLGTIIMFLVWYLRIKSTKVTVTKYNILIEKGLLSKHRREVAIEKVRTVDVKQGFIDRILGVGDIEVYTAGDLPEFEVTGLPNPNEIREIVKKYQNLSEES